MSDLIEEMRAKMAAAAAEHPVRETVFRIACNSLRVAAPGLSGAIRTAIAGEIARRAEHELSRLQSLSDQNRLTGGWRAVVDRFFADEWVSDTLPKEAVYQLCERVAASPPLPLPGSSETSK